MIKKLALITATLISTSAFATMNSTTITDQTLKRCTPNAWCDIFSKHDWSVTNDTLVTQTVSVCYSNIVNPTNPGYAQRHNECEQVTIPSMQTKTGSKLMDFRSAYPYQGGTTFDVSTTISGWQTQSSIAHGRLYLS